MIKASEARQITETTLANVIQMPIMNDIQRRIKSAAEEGYYQIQVDIAGGLGNHSALTGEVVKALKKEGYKLDYYSDQRDRDSYYTISWKD